MAPINKKERYSRQREAILNTVRKARSHPTAEWVYETVRGEIPNISLGTVYRNLKYLTTHGKIEEVILDDNVTRYDGNVGDHYHCICEECGKILDVALDAENMLSQIETQISDFKISTHKLEFYGLCDSCAKKTSN